MPLIAGSLVTLWVTARVTRASVVETFGADFGRVATGEGTAGVPDPAARGEERRDRTVLTTSWACQVGNLLGGAVLIETIFSWPGIGAHGLHGDSVPANLRVVQGATLVIAITFCC